MAVCFLVLLLCFVVCCVWWRCAFPGRRSCVLLSAAVQCCVLFCCCVVSCCAFGLWCCLVLSRVVVGLANFLVALPCRSALVWAFSVRSVLCGAVVCLVAPCCVVMLLSPAAMSPVVARRPWLWCCVALWCLLWNVMLFMFVLCSVPPSCRPGPSSAAVWALVGTRCCCLFSGVCSWVWLPVVVFWRPVVALVSLPIRVARRPVVWCVGVACCGVVLPSAVCCGAVLPRGVAVLASAFLFPLWLVFVFVHHLKKLCKKE